MPNSIYKHRKVKFILINRVLNGANFGEIIHRIFYALSMFLKCLIFFNFGHTLDHDDQPTRPILRVKPNLQIIIFIFRESVSDVFEDDR